MHLVDGKTSVALRATDLRDPRSNTDLVSAAKHGDQDAFAILFRRYRRSIYAIANRFFAPGNDRDDLLQEATIGFFQAIRDFRQDRGDFSAFVSLCVRRQIISFTRHATRQKQRVLTGAISLDTWVRDDQRPLSERLSADSTLGEYIDIDVTEFLAKLLRAASIIEGTVLKLYISGFSLSEIADNLGVTRKVVDNAIWRVRVKARRLVT